MSTFTADDAARRWRCSSELAEEFLQDFAERGLIEKADPGCWRVTPRGYRLACDLSAADDRLAA